MLFTRPLVLLLLTPISSFAQITLTGTNSGDVTSTGQDYPTGTEATYASDASTVTRTSSTDYGTITDISSTMAAGNSSSGSQTTSATRTLLVGGQNATTTASLNGTAHDNSSSTATLASSSAQPTNTQPCNGYPQFCNRKFSNITYVAAHNSPFIQQNNAARNQMLEVTSQLDDGIRMLQFQTHYVNDTVYLCHTSCDLLNAGTLESYLTTVTTWLQKNPYEVIAILIGNQNFIDPQNYTTPVTKSGLINFVYVPPQMPMALDDWPTLAQMIIRNQRAIVMLDYQANQTAIPWLLDEFSQMWETPFSPTERSFPCTPQRPPNQARDIRQQRMYMANHNLNIDVSLGGISLDLPAFNILNETNAVEGYGSVGLASAKCTAEWNRPPNFLLVDFYNIGSYDGSTPMNGSVFDVAAKANNVTWNPKSCCGAVASLAVQVPIKHIWLLEALSVIGAWFWLF